MKLKWGILGTSPIAATLFNAIQHSDDNEVWGIAGRTHAKARQFGNQFSFKRIYTDYETLLADPEIAVVYIALPNYLHKEWIIRCIEANKHILCEKPLVLNVSEIDEIKTKLSKNALICLEGLMYLHHPLINKLKEIIDEQYIGAVRLFQAHYSAYITDVANKIAGGSLRNLACYPISLIRHLSQSEPSRMQAFGRINPETGDDHQAAIMLHLANNTQAVITTADDLKMNWIFEMFGSEGMIKVNTNPWLPTEAGNSITITRYGQTPFDVEVTAEKPLYTYQVDVLSQLIRCPNEIEKMKIRSVLFTNSMHNVKIIDYCLTQVKQQATLSLSSDCFQIN